MLDARLRAAHLAARMISIPRWLRCPEHGAPLRVDVEIDAANAVVACPACAAAGDAAAPIVEGVLVLRDSDARGRMVDAIRRSDRSAARRDLLGKYDRKSRWIEQLGMRLTYRRYIRYRLIKTWRYGDWDVYLQHRFSAPSFLAAMPLLAVLDPGDRGADDAPVLDAPAGLGQLSFVLSKLIAPERVVPMDLQPAYAFAARRFFAPRSPLAVARDMNRALPFEDRSFAAAICLDAFHYVEDKASLVREWLRVIRDDGAVVIAHAHNRLQHNVAQGHALSPSEYAELFTSAGAEVRVLAEDALLDAHLANRPIDLSAPSDRRALDASPALSIVAVRSRAGAERAFKTLPPVRDRLIAASTNPVPNSLFRLTRLPGGRSRFDRDIPPNLAAEYPRLLEILPEHAEVLPDAARDIRALLERNLLIDVPPDY